MIKFRAWDKENKRYLYNVQDAYDPLSGHVKYENGEYVKYENCCFGDCLYDKRYDVEQFTGLKDVNGKDIYEGDIIKSRPNNLTFELPKVGVVTRSRIDLKWCYESGNLEYNIWASGKYRTYEVIGNVHTNPELLVEFYIEI